MEIGNNDVNIKAIQDSDVMFVCFGRGKACLALTPNPQPFYQCDRAAESVGARRAHPGMETIYDQNFPGDNWFVVWCYG